MRKHTRQIVKTPATREDLRLALSPAQAAHAIGIGNTSMYEIIGSGVLASFKIGRRRLIRVQELERYLKALQDNPGGNGTS